MTIVKDYAWSDLLKDTVITAQHGNDGNRIVAATKALKQAAHQFVKVLNDRARLFADSAQFDTAIRDAAAMRALLPRSGLGYLCTGDVYCQQRRYAAAISIYDQGLITVPKSDDYYQQLQQHRKAAIANNSKRVDFISRLPLDIVITNILPRVESKFYSDSLCDYLYVSRTWQKRFLQQPNGLNFDFGLEKQTLAKNHNQLIRFAPYVQRLSGFIIFAIQLDDLFSRARFSNLKELDINGSLASARLPFINGLRLVADTLTHLSINGHPCIQLRDILETCPNIVSLFVSGVDIVMPSSPSSRYPKITYLAIHDVSETARGNDNMVDLLGRFPSLLSFEVSPMPDSSLLTILHEHCPYLQVLYFGGRNYRPTDVRPNGRKGIISAHLREGRNDVYMHNDLIHFLHLHRDSLEELEFRGDIDDGDSFWKLENGKVIQ